MKSLNMKYLCGAESETDVKNYNLMVVFKCSN